MSPGYNRWFSLINTNFICALRTEKANDSLSHYHNHLVKKVPAEFPTKFPSMILDEVHR